MFASQRIKFLLGTDVIVLEYSMCSMEVDIRC